MRAGHPARCLVELGTDEPQETCKVCREHRDAPITAGSSICQRLARQPIDICIELSVCRIRGGMCRCTDIKKNIASVRKSVWPLSNSCCDKMEAPATTQTGASFMPTRVGGRARDIYQPNRHETARNKT